MEPLKCTQVNNNNNNNNHNNVFYCIPLKQLLGSLSNDGGDGYENVTEKANSRSFKRYRAYYISFNLSNVNFFSLILKDCVKVQEKKKKVVVVCSRPPQNVKLGTFMLKLCNDGKEMYKKA